MPNLSGREQPRLSRQLARSKCVIWITNQYQGTSIVDASKAGEHAISLYSRTLIIWWRDSQEKKRSKNQCDRSLDPENQTLMDSC